MMCCYLKAFEKQQPRTEIQGTMHNLKKKKKKNMHIFSLLYLSSHQTIIIFIVIIETDTNIDRYMKIDDNAGQPWSMVHKIILNGSNDSTPMK